MTSGGRQILPVVPTQANFSWIYSKPVQIKLSVFNK